LPAAPSLAFFAKGGIPSSQPHGLLNKPTTNRDNKPGTHGTFVFVTRPRPRSDQSRFVPRSPDSPISFVIPNSILSFRPEPERQRRRSGGTRCRRVAHPWRSLPRVGFHSSQPHGILNKLTTNRDNKPGTHGTFVFVTRPRPRSDQSRSVPKSPDSPIFLSFRILFCHSDRSRSASDGGAEEPAVCRLPHPWRSLPRVGFHSPQPHVLLNKPTINRWQAGTSTLRDPTQPRSHSPVPRKGKGAGSTVPLSGRMCRFPDSGPVLLGLKMIVTVQLSCGAIVCPAQLSASMKS
jgi:hypothetical protein